MKMLIFAKIFATILAIVVFARSYNDLKSKRESLFMTVVWFSVWIGILIVAYFPSIVDKIVETGGKKKRAGNATRAGDCLCSVYQLSNLSQSSSG